MVYFYILGCILFTVYGQIFLKWRMNQQGQLPEMVRDKAVFMLQLFLDPWLVSRFAAAFVATIFWMAAMTKFELSFTYPFMSTSFILVFILNIFVFGEIFTWGKILGLVLITTGIFVTVKL